VILIRPATGLSVRTLRIFARLPVLARAGDRVVHRVPPADRTTVPH
jgi:hypothetical protein